VPPSADDGARLDGLEGIETGFEVRPGSAPAPEGGIEDFVLLPVGGVVVAAVCISLPDLDKDIARQRSQAIKDPPLDADALADGVSKISNPAWCGIKPMCT
jgi:hypothetical protein